MIFDGRVIDIFRENNNLDTSIDKHIFIREDGQVDGSRVGILSDTYSIPVDKVYNELSNYHDILNNYGDDYLDILKGLKTKKLSGLVSKDINLQKLEYYLIKYSVNDKKLEVVSGINNIEKLKNAKTVDDKDKTYIVVLVGTNNIESEEIRNHINNEGYNNNIVFFGGSNDGL